MEKAAVPANVPSWAVPLPQRAYSRAGRFSCGIIGFCPDCGSRIVWQAIRTEDDWMTNLCVGSLDEPAQAGMTCHIYADTQLPWYTVSEDLPKFTESDEQAMMDFIRH